MLTRSSIGMVAGCVGVVIGFPVLYAGMSVQILPLEVIGFIIFGVGILVEPALRFVPKRATPEK
jgi:hypothetical protein